MEITSVRITGSFKAYGFREGLSGGTEISIEMSVPPGTPPLEVKKEIVRQRHALDMMCLRAEHGKGFVPDELFHDIQKRSKAYSEALIHGYDAAK